MTYPGYEFDSEQNSHFSRLEKSNWAAAGLCIFAISNIYVVVRAPGNPLMLFIGIALIALSALAALSLQKNGGEASWQLPRSKEEILA
jgi:hypothetical protein